MLLDGSEIQFKAPYAYQDTTQGRVEVASRYVIRDDGSVGFAVGAYDVGQTLVIDPVLDYSTFLGGTGLENGANIAVDDVGDVYLFGQVVGAGPAGAPDSVSGESDVFVAKFRPNAQGGSDLLFVTYLGGSDSESAAGGFHVNGDHEIIVYGRTRSTDVPTTEGAYDRTYDALTDTFIAKIRCNRKYTFVWLLLW